MTVSKIFSVLVIVSSLFIFGCGDFLKSQGQPYPHESPNVIIFIADDISYNDFGTYGHPVIKTPNIDKLARSGIKFTNAFLTTSSCSPSRISILTGRYPHNTGAPELHTDIPTNQVVFPQLLKDAGYYTAQAGKWHIGNSGVADNAFEKRGGTQNSGGGPSGAEKWVEFLKERPKNKSFFMWYASHDAHRKWDEKIFLESYSPKAVVVPPYMVDSEETREDLALYYNEVTRFDYFVGETVKELKRQNVFENTIIIVMADNGRPFPRDKTRLYDDGIKTPFIVHWPEGIKNGGEVSESLISAIDIAPTILETAGISTPPTFQGKSFLRVLNSPDQKIRKYVFAEHNWHDYQAHERMVSTADFMYIENGLPNRDNRGSIDIMCGPAGMELKKGLQAGTLTEIQSRIFRMPQPERELYMRTDDSLQIKNLINLPEHKGDVTELATILQKWRLETKDSQPKNLTPDWYDREDCSRLSTHGVRGTMPGTDKNAELVNNSGPF